VRINLDQETLGVKSATAVTPMMSFVNAEDRARGVEPEQEKTRDGRLRWELHCHVVKTDAGFPESEVVSIRVATFEHEPPPVVGEYGSPVFFGGLSMNFNPRRSGDGKGYTVSFAADSFSLELPPSQRVAAANGEATASKAKPKAPATSGAAQ
jgi:hypothetical protein